ncbi:threonine--tRNA ligase [Candidatus Micrarchaeota archaeon]|nr:threonine--tRNA ligase [Candidatus Micrarchaeota archaeon]
MAHVTLTLPNGATLQLERGATCLDAARKIGVRLASAALAAKLDGTPVDLSAKLENDSTFEVLTFDSKGGKEVFWHSSTHLMAQAVKRLWPEVALGAGPAVEDGFFYDMERKGPFTPADLVRIGKEMEKIVREDFPSKRIEMPVKEALAFLRKKAGENKFKVEIVNDLVKAGGATSVSFYQQGEFTDLCAGPHIPSTGLVKAFKLTKLSSAYWRGKEGNPSMQRIYGVSFPAKKQLDAHLAMLEEAAKRDHRKLGAELDLFSVQELAGSGLIFYHPKGGLVRTLVEDFIRSEHLSRGYKPVFTPHLFKSDVWKKSGHYDNYKENMYFTEIDGTEYGIKPMNCPGHIMVFNSGSRSYKELPLRLFELGTVYRHELSGVTSGLFRVRGFTQDDSHLFCTPSQLKAEIKGVMEFAIFMLRSFGFDDFAITLSTKPQKAIGDDRVWEEATTALRDVLIGMKLPYDIDAGGGAFYGPKIDLKIKDALGRLWQCTTVQVDFNLPERFDVSYIAEDGKKHRAVMIHRALLGSIERFLGVLIEHYGGALPLWLSPVQVIFLPISDFHAPFARGLAARMEKSGIRTLVDDSQEKLGLKIRNAQLEKIPRMLVIGEREEASGELAVRLRDGTIEQGIPIGRFIEKTLKEIEEKT